MKRPGHVIAHAVTDPQITFALAGAAAAFAVGMSKGGIPMIGMLGVPIMATVMSPITAAGLLLPIYVVSDMFGVWAYRREYSRRNLAIIVPSAALGIAIGWATASIVSEALVMLLVGLVGLFFCLHRWLWRQPATPRPADLPRGVFWGAVSGFTSFVSHAGAPPYQMYVVPQRLPKMVYAGTTTLAFAAINAIKLIPYYALGQLGAENLKIAALLLPVAVAATFIGVRLTRIIPETVFYRLVVIALFVLSVKLVFDGVRAFAAG